MRKDIKMTGWKTVDRTDLAHDRYRLWALANNVINPRVP
jgi:hypothetical protein